MKRDMELIRTIALALNDLPANECLKQLEGVEQSEFTYNARLLIDGGLALGTSQQFLDSTEDFVALFRLTWQGHDFADAIRDDTIWASAKEKILKPAASWTFGLLLEVLKYEIKRKIPILSE